jgi:hypothetical protein
MKFLCVFLQNGRQASKRQVLNRLAKDFVCKVDYLRGEGRNSSPVHHVAKSQEHTFDFFFFCVTIHESSTENVRIGAAELLLARFLFLA